MAVSTAVIVGAGLVLAGGAIGAVAGGMQAKEDHQQALDAQSVATAQYTEQKNAAQTQSADSIRQIYQSYQDGQDQLASQAANAWNGMAQESGQANQELAKGAAQVASARSDAAAAAGMSGVRNSGSSLVAREKGTEQAASDLDYARDSLNRQATDGANATESGLASQWESLKANRDNAVVSASRVALSYADGGDAYNVWQAQKAVLDRREQLAGSKGYKTMSILSGGLSGANSGLNIANGFSNLGAFSPTTSAAAKIRPNSALNGDYFMGRT